jgi:hypothetical protein
MIFGYILAKCTIFSPMFANRAGTPPEGRDLGDRTLKEIIILLPLLPLQQPQPRKRLTSTPGSRPVTCFECAAFAITHDPYSSFSSPFQEI